MSIPEIALVLDEYSRMQSEDRAFAALTALQSFGDKDARKDLGNRIEADIDNALNA